MSEIQACDIEAHDIEARDIGRDDYRAFLRAVPHAVFQRLEWLAAVEAVFGVRVHPVGVFRGTELIAVSPVLARRMGPLHVYGAPLRKVCVPPATPFCAPASRAVECVPALRAWMRRKRIGYLQLTVPGTDVPDAHARVEPLTNLELDLARPLEAVWKSVVDVQRSAVRKAMRLGVRVHVATAPALLETQQALVAATYGAQGLAPNIPAQLYAELYARRHAIGLRVLHATHQGRVVAALWAFEDGHKAYYFDAAARAEARNLNANHLLLWCLTRWAHRRGFATLDCVGTAVGGRSGSRPGIGHFKQSMGARAADYRILYWHTPLLHAALEAYRWLQRLRAARRRK